LEYLGKCALVKGIQETTLFESNMMRLRLDTEKVNPVYFVNYLLTPEAYAQILHNAKKAVNQASINQQDIKSLLVPIPPLQLQTKFTQIAHRYERLRAQQREALRQTENLFQSLLHAAFEGDSANAEFSSFRENENCQKK
jgi:type I restriction enzyme S subunit